jgi:Immunity protein 35
MQQVKMSFAHMITRSTADDLVALYLRKLEREMDLFGSALPENKGRSPHQLVVVDVQEHDFGWVYFYNAKTYAETGDFGTSLVGNSPVIIDRTDGKLYATGTANSTEHYLNEFRRGVRHAL